MYIKVVDCLEDPVAKNKYVKYKEPENSSIYIIVLGEKMATAPGSPLLSEASNGLALFTI